MDLRLCIGQSSAPLLCCRYRRFFSGLALGCGAAAIGRESEYFNSTFGSFSLYCLPGPPHGFLDRACLFPHYDLIGPGSWALWIGRTLHNLKLCILSHNPCVDSSRIWRIMAIYIKKNYLEDRIRSYCWFTWTHSVGIPLQMSKIFEPILILYLKKNYDFLSIYVLWWSIGKNRGRKIIN